MSYKKVYQQKDINRVLCNNNKTTNKNNLDQSYYCQYQAERDNSSDVKNRNNHNI